jgi:hypothetical protein
MDKEVCGGTTNYSWFEGRPAGVRLPQLKEYYKIKELLDLDDTYDELMEEAEREKIGENKTKDFSHHKGSMMSKETTEDWSTKTTVIDITAPATPLARKWDGWGTALKPAHEPIILARKPLDGTVADNVERFGVGAINIDGCRIGDEEVRSSGEVSNAWREIEGRLDRQAPNPSVNKGRFPTNCITTEPDAFFSKYFNVTPPELCKKASKKDRNSNWRGEEIDLPERVKVGERDGRNAFPKNSAGEKGKYSPRMRNIHPTVKPTDLMAWLVRLVTPPSGIVLDPFAGSGSTCVAARREGFFFIGIEQELEYVEIARRRVSETDIMSG